MLEARGISFSYGSRVILNEISFSVRPDAVTAVVGGNGVGKTTLLKILATLTYPEEGTVLADGSDIFRYPVRYRRALGWVGEIPVAEPDMSVRAYLCYRARIKGERTRRIRHRVDEAIDLLGLRAEAGRICDTLSLGQRRRVAFAEAVMLRPRYLLLDDPFAGLDVPSRAAATEALHALSGTSSIVISGHAAEEMPPFVTQVLELKDGRID